MLSPISPPRKSSNLGVVLMTPFYTCTSHLNQTLEIQINTVKLPPKNLNLTLDMVKSTKPKGITFPNSPIFLLLRESHILISNSLPIPTPIPIQKAKFSKSYVLNMVLLRLSTYPIHSVKGPNSCLYHFLAWITEKPLLNLFV